MVAAAVEFGGNIGTGTSNASTTTVTITTTADVEIGDLLVVAIAADNNNATTPTFSAADNSAEAGTANAYTAIYRNSGNATGAAGVAGAALYSHVTRRVPSGSVITVTLSVARTGKAAVASFWRYASDTTRGAAVTATGSSTSASSGANANPTSGDLIIGVVGSEHATLPGGDSDSTSGTWSTVNRVAGGGSSAAGMSVALQGKIVTAAASQTYDSSCGNSDWIAITQAFVPDTAIAPSQVTGLTAAGASASAVLSWTAPRNGGAAISDYLIEYSSNAGSSWSTFSHGASAAVTITVTGLTNETAYLFRVSAINSVGTGPASSTASGTPTAFTVVGTASSQGSAVATAVVNLPTHSSGDLLIFTLSASNNFTTFTTPSGWTALQYKAGGNYISTGLFWRFGDGATSTVNVTMSGTVAYTSAAIAIAGTDATTPIQVTGTPATGLGTNDAATPAITTGSSTEMVLLVAGYNVVGAAVAPSGYTMQVDKSHTSGGTNTESAIATSTATIAPSTSVASLAFGNGSFTDWNTFTVGVAKAGTGSAQALAGSSAGSSTSGATGMQSLRGFVASSASSSLAATSTTGPDVTHLIAAQSDGAGGASGTRANLARPLDASSASTATAAASTIQVFQGVNGNPSVGSSLATATSMAFVNAAFAGTSAGSSTAAATRLDIVGAFAGSSAGSSTATASAGQPLIAGPLVGTSSGASDAAGTRVNLARPFEGVSSAASAASTIDTAPTVAHTLTGTSAGTSTATGTETSAIGLVGGSPATSLASATRMVSDIVLAGSSAGSSLAAASGTAVSMVGSSSATSTASADTLGVQTPVSVGASATSFNSSTNALAVTLPTHAAGNLLLVAITAQWSGVIITPPSGWTQVAVASTTTYVTTGIYRKLGNGSETSATFGFDAFVAASAVCTAFGNVNDASPIHAVSTVATGLTDTGATTNTLTTSFGPTKIVMIAGFGNPCLAAPPVGWTEQADASGGSASETETALATKDVDANPGTVSAATYGSDSTFNEWAAWLIAVAPRPFGGQTLAGTSGGSSTSGAASLRSTAAMAGTSAGATTTFAPLGLARPFAAASVATSDASATRADLERPIIATSAATSNASGTRADVARGLAASSAGASTTAAALTVSTAGSGVLDANSSGSGDAVASTLTVAVSLAATAAGSSTASTPTGPAVSHPLVGTSVASSLAATPTGPDVTHLIAGTSAATSTATATAGRTRPLDGASVGLADTIAALNVYSPAQTLTLGATATTASEQAEIAAVITLPTHATGNLLLVAITFDRDYVIVTTPAGWTRLDDKVGSWMHSALYRKTGNGTETTATFPLDTYANFTATASAISGYDTSAPFNALTGATGLSAGVATAPVTLVTAPGTLVLRVAAWNVAGTPVAPTGHTQRAAAASSTPQFSQTAIASQNVTPAVGSIASADYPNGTSYVEWMAWTIAVAPLILIAPVPLGGASAGGSGAAGTSMQSLRGLVAISTSLSGHWADLSNVRNSMAGTSAGTSSASASMLSRAIPIPGASAGATSDAYGFLGFSSPLNGSAGATSDATATTLNRERPIPGGSAGGTSDAFGTLYAEAPGGNSNGTSGATGRLGLFHSLDGTTAGTSTAVARLSGPTPLDATTSGTSATSATVTVYILSLGGSSAGSAYAYARPDASIPLVGRTEDLSSTSARGSLSVVGFVLPRWSVIAEAASGTATAIVPTAANGVEMEPAHGALTITGSPA